MSKCFYGALALIALVAVSGCKKSEGGATASVSGNLGTVDGDPITYEQFYSYLQRKPVVFAVNQGRQVQVQVADTLGIQTMRDMVQQRLLLSIAKDEGVLPTKDEVDKELQVRLKQNPDYINNLKNAGLTNDEINSDIMLGLASEKIQTKGVTISVEEVKKFIADNKTAFTIPPQANLLVIVVKSDADKAKVDADLKSGQGFGQVAMKYSTVPNARQTMGAYPSTDVSGMPPVLQKLVKDTAADHTTPWQQDHANWVKFYVKSKTAGKPMPITDDLIKQVQKDMAKKKSPNGPDFQKRMIDKIRTANVSFALPFYDKSWKGYVQTEQNAMAAQAAAAPGAPKGK